MKRTSFQHIPTYLFFLVIVFSAITCQVTTAYAAIDCSKPILKEIVVKAQDGNMEAQYELGFCYSEQLKRDYKKAFHWYKKAAEQGHLDSQYYLAEMYKNGIGVKQDKEASVKWYRSSIDQLSKQAEQGDTIALYRLGLFHSRGLGVKRDKEEAVKWYEKAAKLGNVEAMFTLANFYGSWFNANDEKALFWYRKAAEQDHGYSCVALANILRENGGEEQNKVESTRWYKKAAELLKKDAEQGDTDALFLLGEMFEAGMGVRPDKEEAAKWSEKAIELLKKADEQGDVIVQFKLGGMFYYGRKVAQDKIKAAELYRKSAEQGHKQALDKIIKMCSKGDGIEQDNEETTKWLKVKYAGGDAWDLHALGLIFFNGGYGLSEDKNEAIKWFRSAAEQGEDSAQDKLGDIYYKGEGVTQNYKEAAKWYRKASEQGNELSQEQLADMYYKGEGVTQDYKKAFYWYTKSAEQGWEYAQFDLAWMYSHGEGTVQDKKKAAEWYQKAAELGITAAQYNLGLMYWDGKGVLQDEVIAYALFSVAAIDGDENAVKNRDIIAKDLSKQEIKRGRKISKSLLRKIENPDGSSNTTASTAEDTSKKPEISGSGSAFIVTTSGYVITCYHVVNGASKIVVSTNNKEYPAKLIRADKHNDLALLKIEGTFPALSFAPRNSVKMGSDVFTIGYPNPIMQGVNQKFTEGNINALTGYQDDIRLYQISAPIQPGNSGGPLLNKNGDVVGIIVAILKAETAFKVSGSLPQNVNYALKSTYAQALVDTVPEAVENLQQPKTSQSKPFDAVVDRVKESSVMIICYN